MSRTPDELAEAALKIMNEGDPRDARKLLMEAVEAAPDRADLLHALGVVQLQLGEPSLGLRLIEEAVGRAEQQLNDPARHEQALAMLPGFLLALAAACEDLGEASAAKDAYYRVMSLDPGNPRARGGYANLLLGLGDLDGGINELETYIEEDRDEDQFLEGAQVLLDSIRSFVRNDIHPREFLAAHHGSYNQFFDYHAKEQEKLGWIAEAARMQRAPDGRVVPMIPEGARSYAGVRVDLVDPNTGQIGQVGDQPMVVALAEYPALARAQILFKWRELAFDVRVSSQAPWDQLPIHIALRTSDGLEDLDEVMGRWYLAGFNGEFGKQDMGRFHYISDPDVRSDNKAAVYHVDLGRAELACIDDLLRRLTILNNQHPIEKVIFGRGYLG